MIYERVVPARFMPYWLWLLGYGFFVFVAGGLGVAWLGERQWIVTQAVLTVGVAALASLIVFFKHAYEDWLLRRWPVSEDNGGSSAEGDSQWLARWYERLFGSMDRTLRASVVLGTIGAGIATVIASGLPYREDWLNVAMLMLFVVPLAVGGHAAFILFRFLAMLTELGRIDLDLPFGLIPNPLASAVLRFASTASVAAVSCYAVLGIGVMFGPFGASFYIVLWLSTLAMLPLALSVWSVYQIHVLLRCAKERQVERAARLVGSALKVAESKPTAGSLEALERALAAQSAIQRLSDWPFALSSTLAFLAAVATVGAQTTVALRAWLP